MALPPRRWFLYSAVALIFVTGVWWFSTREAPSTRPGGFRGGFRGKGNTMPIPVRAVAVKQQNLPVHLRAIGTVVPLNIVTVRSRVEGPLLRVTFQEGQQVKKGDLLAEIDSAPYQIRLAQADAQFRQNDAQLKTAKRDLERLRKLHAQTLVTQQELEAQQALVAEREGALAGDQAMVDDAARQLAYTKIEAPIAGRLGLRQVDAGNLIRPGDANGLVVITQTRPIAVMFTVPEIDLQKVVEPLRAGDPLPVEAWDRGEHTVLASGLLKTVDNQIDIATGTLRLKAEFPNEDERLFPNQFVNMRLRVRLIKDAVVVPAAAIQYGSRGTYVYVVNEQSLATVRDVAIGPADGDNQSITKGLKPGEQVVLEGVDRLREGRSVTVVSETGVASPAPLAAAPVANGGEPAGRKGKRKEK